MATINVVTEDKVIVVDGVSVHYPYDHPSNLWAIQWDGSNGHAEWTDGPNTEITQSDADGYQTQWANAKSLNDAATQDAVDAADLAESSRIKGYAELRKEAYPSLKEQLDMIYWDKINSTNLWQTALSTVKTTYPK